MDLDEQSDGNPNQPFRSDVPPQFQAQYPYQQGASAFAMDQDMNMNADSFAASVRAHAGTSIDSGTRGSNSGQGATGMNPSGQGIGASDMAPPQGAGHPYSPGGARTSIDDGQEIGLSGGDQKRKRSKVSRACDECRRKKVRCDAAAEDGTIKTCSNCARAGLTCDYSRIPMKRGPSKGYIKELSERVQQVESLQMALSNTPGYRQSLDATGVVYNDQPYSPDDPMSAKRNYSFSGDQRSPFGGPEYHRDRMPSNGGWNSGSPRSAMFRPRDRGSIALAPDQQPTNPISFAKPFWAQDSEAPPAKRQKMDTEEVTRAEISQESLSRYYREFHAYLPILPDADTAIAITNKASPMVQHAFHRTVLSFPSTLRPRNENATNNESSQPVTEALKSSEFKTHQALEEYMWNATRDSPELRSSEDNLLHLWIYLMLAVEAEHDLARLHDGVLPRTILIKQAVDLGWSCVTALTSDRDTSSSQKSSDKVFYVNEFARVWHCATILAKLHALAVGSSSPIPRYFHQHVQKKVPTLFEVLPVSGIIIATTAAQLSVVSMIVQDTVPYSSWGRNADIGHRMVIQETFDQSIDIRAHAEGNEALLGQLRFFLDLTLSRYTVNFHPMDIVLPAAGLAEALRKHLTASDVSFTYNPFHLHFFTLTTITLLEFLSENHDTQLFRVAKAGIDDIKVALEQFHDHGHVDQHEQNSSDGVEASSTARQPIYWSDALLKMIEERVSRVVTTQANGTANTDDNPAKTVGDGTTATQDFSMLLRQGYLTVLAREVGC